MDLSTTKKVTYVAIAVFLLAGYLQLTSRSVANSTLDTRLVSGELDGMDFAGTLSSVDGSISLDDALHFRNGHFWSVGCTKCSFMPGAYWTRRVGEAIEFRGVLESPERGRFTYQGSVHKGTARVSINWRKDRWYWSIDRDYVYEGQLDGTFVSGVTLDRARRRAADEASPTCPI